ncbi:proline rich transmembrane protein 3 [Pitangus sulphuratus]|nr:proline rich transmembrane protein 3 [Pitangus sulphuratus]
MNFNVWNIKEMLSMPTAIGPSKCSMRSGTASDYSSLSDSQLLFGSQFCPENAQSATALLELGSQPGQQNSQDSEPSVFTKYQTKPQLFDEETREKGLPNFSAGRKKSTLENFEVNKNKIKEKYDREVLSAFISSTKDKLQGLQACLDKFEEMSDSRYKSILVHLETLSKKMEDAFQSHCASVLKALTDKSQMEQALLEMERRLAAKDVEISEVKSSVQLLKESLESLPTQLNDQHLKLCKELDFLKLPNALAEQHTLVPSAKLPPHMRDNSSQTSPGPCQLCVLDEEHPCQPCCRGSRVCSCSGQSHFHCVTVGEQHRHSLGRNQLTGDGISKDIPGTQPPAPGTATPSATWRRAGVTPQPVPRNPSSPQPQPHPSHAPPAPGANGTGLRWAELQHQLGLSWEAHVYGLAAIFLLLALGCLAGLAGTAILRPPHLPHTVGAHGLLLAACLLRATFLLLDPYGARGRLPAPALLLLSTAPFPLLLAAFALLLQRLQRLAQLQLLPARLRGLPALGAVAALQSAVLGAADLLPPRLGPAALGLQALGCVAGALLLLGGLWGCWRVLQAPCEEPGPRPGARALLAAAVAGLPVCGLQLYSAVWLRGVLGPPGRFSWPGWAAQLWLRIGELGTALALLATAAEPMCCRCHRQGPAGHSCWAKALQYFCAGRKAEAPEYPNNCYDWAGGSAGGTGAERTPPNDISKSLIRNPAEQLPLRALKDSNEAWAAGTGMTGLSPKCPNMLAARSCATFEQGSSPSLGELIFRPPSPIDLRRSIDQALCRRHLLQDSLFSRPRRGSGPSLHGSPAPSPGLGRMVRCSSLTELPGPRQPPGTITVTVTASASSLESSSLKISWNPWRHGLSSPDSLPLDEAPSRAPLLVPAGPPGWEREGPRGFPALGKAVDSRSLSSDTIEL